LALLHTLPHTPERIQQELALLIPLGVSLTVTEGFAAPEVKTVYARAHELCQQVPRRETSELFSVLLGLFRYHFVGAEHLMARQLGEQLLAIAQPTDDPALLICAHQTLAFANFYLGEPLAAREHLDQEMVLYHHAPQHRSLAHFHGVILGVVGLSCTSLALWSLGYPDQALHHLQEALALAQEHSHPHSVVFALNHTATLHQLRGEEQAFRERVAAGIALATEQGFPLWHARGTVLAGWALATGEQDTAGIAQMRQGLAAYRATGTEIELSYYQALLAEACGQTGQTAEGLRVLGEAVATVTKTDERFYEAELYRLQGELLLQAERQASGKAEPKQNAAGVPRAACDVPAEECFWHAIAIARHQQAKSLELRAAMSLARLWQQQGKRAEARELLAPIYGWFTEGFDTADLQEAKALLKELRDTVAEGTVGGLSEA
jgi:predicted ATPase